MKNRIVFVEANTTGTGMMAIKKAMNQGYEVLFLTKTPHIYSGLYEIGCNVIVINTNSFNDIKNYINNMLEETVGVMTTSDYYLESVARLNEFFGFVGNSYLAIKSCRNKGIFRSLSHSNNLYQPKFHIVESIDSLNDIFSAIQFPCVVKPTEDSGSNNVRLCFNRENVIEMTKKILDDKYTSRGQEKKNEVLIEEYIEGPEFSVEMFSWEGKSSCIGITEKRLTGYPYFVESSHVFPCSLSKEAQIEIEQTVKTALKLVNFRYGASHSEVKWTPKGCIIIEINPRLAGGMIPELIRYSTGIDLLEQQVLSSIGISPEINQIVYKKHAGIHFLTSNKSGNLSRIIGMEEISKLSNVEEIKINSEIGSFVEKPRNFSHRLGYIIISGKKYDEVDNLLKKLVKRVYIATS
ncbi:ATP-grasp domain-containing protein [Sutcliffiella horikoshii]|uniref:ATP-grasp domain-containing protein n=1 Tax=Sutcliffiella horikoshii TaxID=79883 RepID=A0A5D4SUB0_9BACI|nr:ATP-grasp domain-containing protein [Sutcliffiella horikoshii]TYS65782.1 ATP-grasp domain-containing protein [Sutcliffiella horikoshii]